MQTQPVREVAGGVELSVRVQPKARRSGILGLHDGRLKIAVNAPPENGKANAAVVKLLAETLGVPRSSVELLRGATSRSKDLKVSGVSLQLAQERLLP